METVGCVSLGELSRGKGNFLGHSGFLVQKADFPPELFTLRVCFAACLFVFNIT